MNWIKNLFTYKKNRKENSKYQIDKKTSLLIIKREKKNKAIK